MKDISLLALAALLLACAAMQPARAEREAAAPLNPAALDAEAALAQELWRNPLDVIRVNSRYGHVGNVHRSMHKGIDFGAPRGTPVLAAASGTVVNVSRDGQYGIYVLLEHAQRQHSMYAHLDSALVRAGDVVASGQEIGKVGTTGKATGPHLHFEAFQDERRVNPQMMLAGLEDLAGMAGLEGRASGRKRYAPRQSFRRTAPAGQPSGRRSSGWRR